MDPTNKIQDQSIVQLTPLPGDLLLTSPGTTVAVEKAAGSGAGNGAGGTPAAAYAPQQLLVRFKTPEKTMDIGVSAAARTTAINAVNGNVKADFAHDGLDGLYLVEVPASEDLATAKARLDADPNVEYTSLNYIRYLDAVPDDPDYGQLWGLHNTGQEGGTPGADINASVAWDTTTGSPSVVVALLDTGVDYNHVDLAGNIWTNPGEIPDNGIDDDANGFVDDWRGWNFGTGTNDPMDSYGHGTHCAGTIGATGNNGVGVTGVNWQVRIMPLRVSRAGGSIYDSDAIEAIHYAGDNGADIISCSWGGAGYNPALRDAIAASPCLFVISAGNSARDNDILPAYPASYTNSNIISVAASDNNDSIASFSNYGKTSVDIAAPGVGILSTLPMYYEIPEPVFTENFSSMAAWQNTSLHNWTLDTGSYTSPPSSVSTGPYVNNGNYTLEMKSPVLLTNMSNPVLRFGMKGRTEAGYDYFFVYVSPDKTHWYPLDQKTGDFGNWSEYQYSLKEFGGQPIYIRLHLLSDFIVTDSGVWIDDLMVGNGTTPIPRYGNYSGTSMATPHVTGIAALLKAHDPALTVQDMKDRILLSASHLPQWEGLTVTGGRADAWVALSSIPFADFSASRRTGVSPLTVVFTERDINTPAIREWDFGDGDSTNASRENPVHTYRAPGTYNVSIMVSNAEGTRFTNRTGYIRVYDPSAGDWTEMDPMPEPRLFHTLASADTGVYVIGGYRDIIGASPNTEVYRYDLLNGTWGSVHPAPVRLLAADAVTIGPKIYVPGDVSNGTTFVYDTRSDTWSTIPPNNGYTPRYFYQSVASGTDVVVLGGVKSPSGSTTNEVWRLNTHTGTWSPGVPLPEARRYFSAGSYNDEIVVTGGFGATGAPLVSTKIFDGTRWNTGSSIPAGGTTYPAWAYNAAGQTSDGNLWIAGGLRYLPRGAYNNTGVYYPGNNTWVTSPVLPSLNQPRMYTSGTVAPDGYFYVSGGTDLSFITFDSFERLKTEASSLRPVAGFTANVTNGFAPQAIGFTDTSTGSPGSWNWSFGDGEFAEIRNPTHTYTVQGNYTVSLNITNPLGSDGVIRTDYIHLDPPASTDPVRTSPGAGTVFIGEYGLNITKCIGTNTTIAWFGPGAPGSSGTPDKTIDVAGKEHAFNISPAEFGAFTGSWYSWAPGSTLDSAPVAFQLVDPAIDITITDETTGADAGGKTIPVGDQLAFRVDTNAAGVTGRGIDGVPIVISVTGPAGRVYRALTNQSGTVTPLHLDLAGPSYDSGPVWDTENSLYPAGSYNVTIRYDLNGMSGHYPVPGKTLQSRTINLSTSPGPIRFSAAIRGVAPASAFPGSTTNFTITGTDFQPGTANTTVQFRNRTDILVPTLTGVTTTRIDGFVVIPEDAAYGPWNIRVATLNGGESTLVGKFAVTPLMRPVITGLDRTTGVRTERVSFTLTGANFQPGDGNTGVTLYNRSWYDDHTGNVTAMISGVTSTQIRGNFTIPADSPAGPDTWIVNVTTVSGGTSIARNTWVTVAGPGKAPVVTSINPTAFVQNTTAPFTLTGSGFQIGTAGTNVTFYNKTYFDDTGKNLTVRLTGVTPTTIAGLVTIPGDAATGPNGWQVNVTTVDHGTSTAGNLRVTVSKPVPVIATLDRTSGVRTERVSFTLTGSNFQAGPGNTTVTLYNRSWYDDHTGNVTAMLSDVTSTQIRGNFTIPVDSPAGPDTWIVNVTTVNGGTSIARNTRVSVTGLSKAPVVASINPTAFARNTTVPFTLTGSGFQIGTAGTNVTFYNKTYFDDTGKNLTVRLTGVTPTAITGLVTIPGNATTGTNGWQVNVTTVDHGTSTAGNLRVTVSKPVPVIATLDRTSGVRTELVAFTLTGSDFQPGYGNTTVTLYNKSWFEDHTGNLTAMLASVTSTQIKGNFTIPVDSPAGPGTWIVNVTTVNGGTSVTKNTRVTVTGISNAPVVTSINPATFSQNTTVAFTLTGANFQIGTAGTNVTFYNRTWFDANGRNMTVRLAGVSPTTIRGSVDIPADAPIGSPGWSASVTTLDGGTSVVPVRFIVTRPVPAIGAMTPSSGVRNELVRFTLTGANFQPGNGNTTVTLSNMSYADAHGENVTARLISVTPTTITGNFTVPADSPFGKTWTVNVTTVNGGTSTSPIVFTVAASKKPAIASVTPATPWYRNATVRFRITGTNFEPDATSVEFRYAANGTLLNRTAGVSIDTVTPTTIDGSVVVPAYAPAGAWKAGVTTLDGGTVTKSPAFTVAKFPAPIISSITPGSGSRNSTMTFTITGANFQPGLTLVNLSRPGSSELDTTIYSATPSQIIGGVHIPGDAAPGAWNLNVTTLDGGRARRPSAMIVSNVSAPGITGFVPVSGSRDTTVAFTLTGSNFQSGGRSTVNLTRPGQTEIPTTLAPVYSARITGTVDIPPDAAPGPWNVTVTTLDGGNRTRVNAITLL